MQFSQTMSHFYDKEDIQLQVEPMFQAVWYYIALVRLTMKEYPKSNFPSILQVNIVRVPMPMSVINAKIIGAHVGFAGVIRTDA